ncbi:hypothetical protein PIB30_084235 [Stylosanthes scabra]|uniref:Transposase (Putative), gypsy type n=1 Tax=Stylosanthes scabra TaxID=79078 RepID=A0ABU6SSN7_9FABA|nr:hypothetical protein [Stylosanthes scabra]
MAKKKSCQNVRVPRVLSVAERELYGWVDEEIFTQPSVVEADALPELRHEMRLTADRAAEGDYVLEAASSSDRLPFWAQEDRVHFLWVYSELFTRLGVRLPFTDFQKQVLSRCRVAASQLHLNGRGFLRTFERVCLHFEFRPSCRVFLYTYQLHTPPPRRGFMSFRAYQGRKLFDSFEESIQEFKCHYFKVLPLPGKRPFWPDDEGAPFPWVYWNAEVGDFRVTALDPLETLAFEFLQSLPAGLEKKSNFKCCWILDHSNADVGAFLALSDSLLKDVEKQIRFDCLMQRMKEAEGAGPRSILLSSKAQTTSSGVSASGTVPAPSVPLVSSSGASKATGKSTSAAPAKPFSMENEEGVKEDPTADLRQKRRKRKVSEASAEEAALGGDSVWKQKVNPIDRAFRRTTISGLLWTLASRMLRFLLGTAQSLLANSPLPEQAVELESCRSALTQEEKKVESLSQSLKGKQTVLDEAEAAAVHWRDELRSLGEETGEMVQETFEILMDQVRHLNPAIDYSMITLDTRWDPKAKRIYNPKAEAQDQPEPAVKQSELEAEEQRAEGVVAGEGGVCPS